MSKLFVNTIAPNSGDTVTISGSLTTTGKLTIGDESTDTVVLTAEVSSSILPDVTATFDLGTMSKAWRNLHAHGLGHIHTASINVVSSSLLPDANETYDLGLPAKRWNNLYAKVVSASTLTAPVILAPSDTLTIGAQGSDTVTFTNDVVIGDDLTILDNLDVRGDISASGNVTASGAISSSGAVFASGLTLAGSSGQGNITASNGHFNETISTSELTVNSSGSIDILEVRTISASSLPTSEAAANSGQLFTLSGSQIFSSSAFPGGSNPVFSSGATSQSLFVFLKP